MYTIYPELFAKLNAEQDEYETYFHNIQKRLEADVLGKELTEKDLRNMFSRLFTSDYPQINLWYKKF